MTEHPIRAPLRKKNRTQAWLAEQIGRSPQAVTDWLKRRYAPSWSDAKRIGLVLDIPASVIMDWHEQADGGAE